MTIGEPRGFREDYTTGDAVIQALAVQTVSVTVALLILGLFVGRIVGPLRLRTTMIFVNPVTIGLAHLSFRALVLHSSLSYEYFSYLSWLYVSLFALIIFAPTLHIGTFAWVRRTTTRGRISIRTVSWPVRISAALTTVCVLCLISPPFRHLIAAAIDHRMYPQ